MEIDMTQEEQAGVPRRIVLAGVGATSAAILAGCASYGPGTGSGGAGNSNDGGDTGDDPTGVPNEALPTSAIPVGGGVVLGARNVVVTQPKSGEFKAFTATCTHQGCTIADVKDGTINCPCHGSKFSPVDGSVVAGPAPRPLDPVSITVNGTGITFN
jgi:Rieske Fe-S protein